MFEILLSVDMNWGGGSTPSNSKTARGLLKFLSVCLLNANANDRRNSTRFVTHRAANFCAITFRGREYPLISVISRSRIFIGIRERHESTAPAFNNKLIIRL